MMRCPEESHSLAHSASLTAASRPTSRAAAPNLSLLMKIEPVLSFAGAAVGAAAGLQAICAEWPRVARRVVRGTHPSPATRTSESRGALERGLPTLLQRP